LAMDEGDVHAATERAESMGKLGHDRWGLVLASGVIGGSPWLALVRVGSGARDEGLLNGTDSRGVTSGPWEGLETRRFPSSRCVSTAAAEVASRLPFDHRSIPCRARPGNPPNPGDRIA